jgi:hypothetical protein
MHRLHGSGERIFHGRENNVCNAVANGAEELRKIRSRHGDDALTEQMERSVFAERATLALECYPKAWTSHHRACQ